MIKKAGPSRRVEQISKSAIHEMTRLSMQFDDVAFLSWAKPTAGTPEHINRAAMEAIEKGLTGGYSPSDGLEELRLEIVKKLERNNHIQANPSQLLVTIGAIEGLAALQGSYLMFPRILLESGKDSTAFCKELLEKIRVSTTPGIAFGPTGEGHLRLSFCVPLEMINKAFDRMDAHFS